MIEGLYETHIQVKNLEKAVQFYTQVLGLPLAHYDETRPIAFLWIGEHKKAMLGLWEQPENVQKRHFAFSCSKDFIYTRPTLSLKTTDCRRIISLRMVPMRLWSLPGCRLLRCILMIRTETNWNSSMSLKAKANRNWVL